MKKSITDEGALELLGAISRVAFDDAVKAYVTLTIGELSERKSAEVTLQEVKNFLERWAGFVPATDYFFGKVREIADVIIRKHAMKMA